MTVATPVGGGWAMRFDRADAVSLGAVRLLEIEVFSEGDSVWLRGASGSPVEGALRRLPACQRFAVRGDDLFPLDAEAPRGYMPSGPWVAIDHWLNVSAPAAALPGELAKRVSVGLRRDGIETRADMLLCDRETWARYCAAAPQCRLDRSSFVIDGNGRVLVRGHPVPAIPGQRFYLEGSIALPLGYCFDIDASVVERSLKLESGDIALFDSDGSWSLIPQNTFVRATRSAVRDE